MDRPVLHVGVPMWAHRGWIGRFLPAGTPTGGELREYSARLNAVEGNTTFYASPAPVTVERWAATVPDGFEFTFKLPRAITHERRLRSCAEEVGGFCDLLAPAAAHVGALTVQLPSSFAPDDLPALDGFLRTAPRGWRWCVEVRHRAFSDGAPSDALDRVLDRHGAERVTFDTSVLFAEPPTSDAERIAWERKPRVRARSRALTDRPVVRYIGRDDPARTIDGWQRWLPVIARWLHEGRRPTFFVHTPDDLRSPELAERFHAEVAGLVLDLAPLQLRAGDGAPRTAEQPSLF